MTASIGNGPSPLSFYFPSVSNSSLNSNAKAFVPGGSLYSHTLNPRARLFIPGISHTDINSDARNIFLNPCAHVFVSRVCVSDMCEYSALNVNTKEFIPFSTLNLGKAINYVINSVNSRLGAIVAISFILAIFIFKSLGFLEIRHHNITPKTILNKSSIIIPTTSF